MHIFSPETDNCPSWISWWERMTIENMSWYVTTKESCTTWRGSNLRPLITNRMPQPMQTVQAPWRQLTIQGFHRQTVNSLIRLHGYIGLSKSAGPKVYWCWYICSKQHSIFFSEMIVGLDTSWDLQNFEPLRKLTIHNCFRMPSAVVRLALKELKRCRKLGLPGEKRNWHFFSPTNGKVRRTAIDRRHIFLLSAWVCLLWVSHSNKYPENIISWRNKKNKHGFWFEQFNKNKK